MRNQSYQFTDVLTEEDLDSPRASLFVSKLTEHFKAIYLTVVRMVGNLNDVDDVLHDACVKMWSGFETLEDMQRFRGWACRIASNTAIDFLREKRAKTGFGLTDATLMTIVNSQKASEEYLELRLEVLNECIRELSEEHQNLVIDVYTHGKGMSTLVEKYSKPARTLYMQVKKIREILYQCVNRKLKVS